MLTQSKVEWLTFVIYVEFDTASVLKVHIVATIII
jgi:hypothetical protein